MFDAIGWDDIKNFETMAQPIIAKIEHAHASHVYLLIVVKVVCH